MKTYFSILAAAAIACSCSNNEITEISPTAERPIGFSTIRDKTTTRFANDGKDNYEVYAIIAGSTSWYFNTTVTPNTSGTAGALDQMAGTYYWPQSKTVDFFAFCPIPTADNVVVGTTTPGTAIPITYTLPTGAQQDFTIATKATGTAAANGTSGVPLSFSHMLSKINIVSVELASTITNYVIETGYSATLSVPVISGTIDAATAASSTTNPWTVTTPTTSTSYTGALSYMIMPQPSYNGTLVQLQITGVVIKTVGGADFFSGVLKPIVFDATTITDGAAFEAGKQYNITVTITDESDGGTITDPDNPIFNNIIQVSSDVVSWTDPAVDVPIDQP